MKPVHVLLSFLLATASGVPVRYDQRQEGDLNVHAHLENFIIVLIPSSAGLGLLDFIPLKKDAHHHAARPANDTKFIPHGTGIKVSAPDFPAANSPYKVDLDKSEGEISKVQNTDDEKTLVSIGEEVVIAQAPTITISKTQSKEENEIQEASTVTITYEDVTTLKSSEEELGTTEKDDPDRKENDVEKAESKEEENKKKTEDNVKLGEVPVIDSAPVNPSKEEENKKKPEDNVNLGEVPVIDSAPVKPSKEEENKKKIEEKEKDEKKAEDNVPAIDSVPVKPSKSSKSFDFGIDVAKSVNGEVEESPRFYSPRGKVAKVPLYRHALSSDPVPANTDHAHHLKMLRTGVEGCNPDEVMTEDGDCQPIKSRQRSGNYFKPEDKLLSILQFGLAPAESD